MNSLGNVAEDSTLNFKFPTRQPSTGAPFLLAGTPSLAVYKGSSTTQSTAGITLTVGFDGVTGMNHVTIDLSSDAFYETGEDYDVVIAAGTVDSISAVGQVVARFSIQNRYASVSDIANSVTAASNLALQFNGTGLTGDTFPAPQSQVAAIGSGSSSAFNYPVSADNTGGAIIDGVTFVGTQTGTYANTEANLETFHQITGTATAIDLVYRIAGGVVNQFTGLIIDAYLNSNNDELNVQLYDHVGADWETVHVINGTNGSSPAEISISPFAKHTGALGTAEAGNMYVRFVATGQTSPELFIARVVGSAVAAESTMGYEGGAVYCDEASGTSTGIVQGEDGIFANQSDDFDNAQTIADNLGTGHIVIANGNSITLTAALEGYSVYGNGGILALGGQDIGDSIIREFGQVSGIATTSANPCFFENVLFTVVATPPGVFQQCGCDGSFTMGSAGDFTFVDCYSIVAGTSSPVFTKTPGQAVTAEWRRFSGGITVSNIESGDVYTISGELGTVTLNGADGTVEIRGTYKAIVDNRTGSPVLNADGAIKGVDVASTLEDTNELQTDWADGGRLDLLLDAVKAVTDNLPNSGALTDLSAAIAVIDSIVDNILLDTDDLQTNQGNWLTATGFSTHSAAAVRVEMDANSTGLAAIFTDTNTNIPATLATLATASKLLAYIQLISRKDSAIGTDNSAELTEINADEGSGAGAYDNESESQEAIGDRLPALVSGRIAADMQAISGSAAAADKAEQAFLGIVTGQCITGTLSATQATTDLTETTDDHYIGRTILFVGGVLDGQASDITDYAGASKLLTFSELTEAPANGQAFVLV